jgi:biotin transport system substrate-specific component
LERYPQATVKKHPDHNKQPRSLSPTPLRDWMKRQSRFRRAALSALFTLLIASGGQAAVYLPYTPIPATQQLLFVLLAGVMLGSRLGAISAALYLLGAASTQMFWPPSTGAAPLLGPMAGYLWSLPMVAYLGGLFVERARSETPIHFATGVCAAIGAYNACGSLRLIAFFDMGGAEAFIKGAGFFIGQQIAQGALAIFIASSASTTLQAREQK